MPWIEDDESVEDALRDVLISHEGEREQEGPEDDDGERRELPPFPPFNAAAEPPEQPLTRSNSRRLSVGLPTRRPRPSAHPVLDSNPCPNAATG